MRKRAFLAAVILLLQVMCHFAQAVDDTVGEETALAEKAGVKKEEKAKDPHGDSTLCISCHTSAAGGKNALLFGGNVSQLCQSCHDGRLAGSESHPSELTPSAEIAQRIPSDLPLYDGMLTCLSCHDIASRCKAEQTTAIPNRNFLRGLQGYPSPALCFRCHAQENYPLFDVHDQLAGGKMKTDTCGWCHIGVPDVNAGFGKSDSYVLRSKSYALCTGCHPKEMEHPADSPHLGLVPSPKTLCYMYAYEIQPKMRLSIRQLLEYTRAAGRAPRSIPLDDNGGITCYSCHNPHEKGLLPYSNPRSIGADTKQAQNHRLRAREDNICIVCHDKGSTP